MGNKISAHYCASQGRMNPSHDSGSTEEYCFDNDASYDSDGYPGSDYEAWNSDDNYRRDRFESMMSFHSPTRESQSVGIERSDSLVVNVGGKIKQSANEIKNSSCISTSIDVRRVALETAVSNTAGWKVPLNSLLPKVDIWSSDRREIDAKHQHNSAAPKTEISRLGPFSEQTPNNMHPQNNKPTVASIRKEIDATGDVISNKYRSPAEGTDIRDPLLRAADFLVENPFDEALMEIVGCSATSLATSAGAVKLVAGKLLNRLYDALNDERKNFIFVENLSQLHQRLREKVDDLRLEIETDSEPNRPAGDRAGGSCNE